MSENQFTAPDWAVGFVYLFGTSERFQKIGFSGNPAYRASQMKGLPFCVWLEHAFLVGEELVESVIHKSLSAKRLRCEWFVLSAEDIAAFKRIREARTWRDLPDLFRTSPGSQARKANNKFGVPSSRGKRARPWYRFGRGWFVTLGGRQHPLRVYDPDDRDGAKAAFARLLESLPDTTPVRNGTETLS